MQTVNIELSETQYKGLEYVAVSPKEWADNVVRNRARIANDEIIDITVKYCLDNGVQVPPTREDIVKYAFQNGIVKTAAERQADAETQDNL